MRKPSVAEDVKIVRTEAFFYTVIIFYIGTADNYTSAHKKHLYIIIAYRTMKYKVKIHGLS